MSADDAALFLDTSENETGASDWDEPTPCPLTLTPDSIFDPWYRRRRGLLSNEVPLRPDIGLSCAEDLEDLVGLKPTSEQQRAAQFCVLANALYGHARSPGAIIFYSRDRNHYAGTRKQKRYFPNWYSYRNVIAAVEALEEAGLIEHWRTKPNAKFRSRFRARPSPISILESRCIDFICAPRETIVLRSADGSPIDYRETDRTFDMRRDVQDHNAFLSDFNIGIDHPDIVDEPNGFLRVEGCWLDPRRCSYRRIFNGRFCCGGRWYGPWWQNLPEKMRLKLSINGEAVFEHDYCACHLRLLYALRSIALPCDIGIEDPYEVRGFQRKHIKTAFNIMLNAKTEIAAERAIARELTTSRVPEPYQHARAIMTAVASQFGDLGEVWCRGLGLRLQNIDARICSRVQHRLRKEGVPALSVHDSFIVPESAQDMLKAVMEEEMLRACERAG